VFAFDVADDRVVHFRSRAAQRAPDNHAAERDDGDLVVPPPMSTIMLAIGSATGRSAPIAAASGSSTGYTSRARRRGRLLDCAPLDAGQALGTQSTRRGRRRRRVIARRRK